MPKQHDYKVTLAVTITAKDRTEARNRAARMAHDLSAWSFVTERATALCARIPRDEQKAKAALKNLKDARQRMAGLAAWENVHCYAGIPRSVYLQGAPFDTGAMHGPLRENESGFVSGFSEDRAKYIAEALD